MLQFFPRSQQWFQVKVLTGREAILAQQDLLAQFAEASEQTGAMGWLDYFFRCRNGRGKRHCVVMLLGPGSAGTIGVQDIYALGLYKEYRLLGMTTGVFLTDDSTGVRTVIAPPGRRSEAGAAVAEALLRQGAHVVLTSVQRTAQDEKQVGPLLGVPRVRWSERQRTVRKQMWLGTTFEETLHRLGKSTRFNLRYYRRRLASKVTCEYVADARMQLREEELAAINRNSLNPCSLQEMYLRYRSACGLPEGFLVGLRDSEGRWLSLIGGWRQGDTTYLHWQVNAAGYEKDSLCTVMRSYFLQDETERKTRRLVVYGGTNHSMSNSFDVETVCDLVALRQTAWTRVLMAFSAMVKLQAPVTGWTHVLATVLQEAAVELQEVPTVGLTTLRDTLETA